MTFVCLNCRYCCTKICACRPTCHFTVFTRTWLRYVRVYRKSVCRLSVVCIL